CWHPGAQTRVVLAAPIEVIELEVDAELACRGSEHPQPLGHDLLADPVTWNDCDSMLAHVRLRKKFWLAPTRRPRAARFYANGMCQRCRPPQVRRRASPRNSSRIG